MKVGKGVGEASNQNCCLCWASELAVPPANLMRLKRWQSEMGRQGGVATF